MSSQPHLTELRTRAERLLDTVAGMQSDRSALKVDSTLLAEELRVYQAELEIQNQELVTANSALESVRSYYKSLFFQLPIPAVILGRNGAIHESNQRAKMLFPALEQSTVAVSVYGLLTQRDLSPLQQAMAQAFERDHDTQCDVVMASSTQPVHPFRAHVHPQLAHTDGSDHAIMLLVDQSAQRQAQALSHQFQAIARHVPGMLYQFQMWPDGRCGFPLATPGIQAIYGLTPDAVASDIQELLSRIHPDDAPRVAASIMQSKDGGTLWRCRYRVSHPDGREIWVEGEAGPESLPDGSVVWHGYIHDITDAVQLEEQLRTERQRMANVIWGTGVGTWEWNVQTGETRFNERWAEVIGYSLAELEPVSIGTWMRFVHPDDLNDSELQLQRHFNGELEYYACEARMRHRDGHWVWVLDRGRLISRTPEGLPQWMAGIHLDITERKAMEARLSQLANHDSLTGLPRRVLLADRLSQAIAQSNRRGGRLAVAFIDLDGFKHINDLHGHEAGDHVLVELARRMTGELRSGDTVARLGGDEFVMLLTDLQHDDDGIRHLQRVMDAIALPVPFGDAQLAVTASIGISHFIPGSSVDPDHLLRVADKAMYVAKAAGKNCIRLGQ